MARKLKIAMISTPWIKVPPAGYGGTEIIVNYLARELTRAGHKIELFTTGDTKHINGVKRHYFFEKGQYSHIGKPLYEAVPIPITHALFSLTAIRDAGDFDIIHDHNGYLGPAIMHFLDPEIFPPVLHTLHGPFSDEAMVDKGMPDNRTLYSQFAANHRLFMNGISKSQLKLAPKSLKPRLIGAIHNAIDTAEYPFKRQKDDYFITLARFARDKGQHLAAKLSHELGVRLKMAGIVAGIADPRQVLLEIANPLSSYRTNPDFKYYSDHIFPLLHPGRVDYVGNLAGQDKLDFIKNARALLFPIDWEEPFGLAPIEALACGTPVIAMKRGALPEIIEHGKNGFLAKTPAEFKKYMKLVDQIDPADCRKSVEEKFSASVMAQKYLDAYRQILALQKR